MARERGHRGVRRRRARLRALPVHARRARRRLLRHLPPQVAAGADRHRLPLRAQGEDRRDLAADGGAAPSMDDNIRKFEEIGTHPAANHNAIAEALAFHRGIGAERKIARLRYLRDRWAKRLLAESDRVTDPHPARHAVHRRDLRSCSVDGIDPGKLAGWLLDKHRIVTTPIVHPEFTGHPDHAERLHDARRDRHLRRLDGAGDPEGDGIGVRRSSCVVRSARGGAGERASQRACRSSSVVRAREGAGERASQRACRSSSVMRAREGGAGERASQRACRSSSVMRACGGGGRAKGPRSGRVVRRPSCVLVGAGGGREGPQGRVVRRASCVVRGIGGGAGERASQRRSVEQLANA